MRGYSWNGSDEFAVLCYFDEDNKNLLIDESPAPVDTPVEILNIIANLLTEAQNIEIYFKFNYNGYYDPGELNDLPENCHPPENENEDKREVTGLYVKDVDTKGLIYITDEDKKTLMSNWKYIDEKLYSVKIDTKSDDSYDPPDVDTYEPSYRKFYWK
ncbi:MAG: hypothetical protein AABY32_01420 [Nanoarchaeota archaeon]